MPKKNLLIALFVFLALISIGTVWAFTRPDSGSKIDPALADRLAGMDAKSSVLVWVMFTDKGEGKASVRAATGLAAERLSPLALERRRKALGTDDVGVYEDLPVRRDYVSRVENLGGRMRVESRWLNAASFLMPAGQIQRVSDLDCVSNIRQVAVFKDREMRKALPRNTLKGKEERSVLLYDYGPSEDQLRQINVLKVHAVGLTGAGANIGILDTGFRTSIKALENVKVKAQYDFIGGDELLFYKSGGAGAWDSTGSINQRANLAENLTMAVDKAGIIHVFYEADTIRDKTSARDIFHSMSTDSVGDAWFIPPTNVSMNEGLSRRPCAVASDTVYLFWEEGGDSIYNADGDQDIIMAKWFADSIFGFKNISNDFGWSTWPAAFLIPGTPDRIHLAWMDEDSTIIYSNSTDWSYKYFVSSLAGEGRVSPPSIAVDDSGYIHIVWSREPTGQLYRATSQDDGFNFSLGLVRTANSDDPALATADSVLHLFFSDFPDGVTAGVMYTRSVDHGVNWSEPVVISGSLSPFLGRVSASARGSRVVCTWENHGTIYVRRSTDYGNTWGVMDSLPPTFSYDPVACCFGSEDFLTFKKRGDDNTDFQIEEDGDRQHWHGTEMLSIIAGFKPTQLVGPAFNANFYLAKTEKYVNIKGYPHFYEMPCEEDFWVQGLEWLESQGVDIVSSSLGYPDLYEYYRRDGKTALVTQAACKAARLGVLVLSSIGNAGEADTVNPGSLYPPSDADSILSVGGVLGDGTWLDPGEGYGFYSAKGPTADGRTKPEVVAPVEVYMTNPAYEDSFWYGIGTSGSAVITAGVAGLLLEAHPSWRGDPMKMRDCLMQTASMDTSPNDTMGWGIVNAEKAVYCQPLEVDTFSTDCLARSYPNPVRGDRGHVTIAFHLINQSIPRIRIYTMAGELVWKWEPGEQYMPGWHELDWDLKNEAGKDVAAGIYPITLTAFGSTCQGKLAVVR